MTLMDGIILAAAVLAVCAAVFARVKSAKRGCCGAGGGCGKCAHKSGCCNYKAACAEKEKEG